MNIASTKADAALLGSKSLKSMAAVDHARMLTTTRMHERHRGQIVEKESRSDR